jgi:hypothetical protein
MCVLAGNRPAALQPQVVLAAYATAGILLLVGADLVARRRARQDADQPTAALAGAPLPA